MVGQRPLKPLIVVRIHVPQPAHVRFTRNKNNVVFVLYLDMRNNKIILIIFILIIILGFVAYFFYFKNKNISLINNVDTTFEVQKVLTLEDGRQCYTYSHEATPDAPYTTTEFIDITINGKVVTGTKNGTQNGPDMTNGYTGIIAGTLENNGITDVYSYIIEGSKGKEKEIYKAGLVGLEKLRYPLIDQKGVQVPDTTKPFKVLIYGRVGCTGSN